MPAYKYYAQENARHPDVKAAVVGFGVCQAIASSLFKYFKVPEIQVSLLPANSRVRRTKSWYNAGSKWMAPHIVLHRKMLNPLTVAHEVAHYVHDYAYRAKKEKIPTLPRERWHGPQHQRYTDEAVEYLRGHQAYGSLFTTRLEKLKNATKGEPLSVDEYFNKLPDLLKCPKCGARRHKNAFGVRVMMRDAQGRPMNILRQSHCKPCRQSARALDGRSK